MLETLQERVNADARLVWRGRYTSTVFMVETGSVQWLVKVDEGRIAAVTRGPFVMANWTFALRASEEAWRLFWQALPPPGSNDLFALIKRRAMKVEGDLHPFMANLFYFKGVLAAPRASGVVA